MRAKALGWRGLSVVCALALLASCKLNPTYKVGGMVSDLAGTGLVLQNNGGDDLAISSSGPFTFSTAIKKGKAYNVTVRTQPSGQSCTVDNGSGTVSRNVTDVRVDCTTTVSSYTVGGMVSGVAGAGLVLQNNFGNDLPIPDDGPFVFSNPLGNGAGYSVTVLTPPSGQGCSITNASGTIAGANVTNIAVACAAAPAAPTLSLAFGVKELQFSWAAVSGATFYRLFEDPDGASGFAQVATNITALGYNHVIPVHRRLNASYAVEACNAGGCARSLSLILGTDLTNTIGYVKASNTGAGDQFGMAVALSADGNTLAVGAHAEGSGSGAVYVFARSAGIWVQQAYIKASNAEAGDSFGAAVALSGDGNTLAVGAQSEASALTGIISGSVDEVTTGNVAPNSGAVYVFTRNAGTWSQQAYIKASNTETFDMFGTSVAVSGDGNTLAVGAVFESNGIMYSGAVYVFTRNGAWLQQAFVKASNPETFDMFGNSVALSSDGNTLAVGAPREDGSSNVINGADDNMAPDAGAVYVFARNAGTWSQQAYVKASNAGADDFFGIALALSGDGNTLAVGATGEASALNNAPSSGAAYVYTRSAGSWSQQSYIKASNSESFDEFGFAVALSGDGNTLAVGAHLEDGSGTGIDSASTNSATDSGALYVYSWNGSTWSQRAYVKASNTGSTDRFGNSVALNGDGNTLAVGALMEDGGGTGIGTTPNDTDVNTKAEAGAVYLY